MRSAVLLSGGVDSAVALHLLRQTGQGDLTAYYLKVWLEDEVHFAGDCPWEEDLRFARATCRQLGVPLEIVPLQHDYRERIVEHVLAELRAGRTPSPDVFCNRRIKFGAFLERLEAAGGIDVIASGHYARLDHPGADDVRLRCAVDPVKDQTYFLSRLTRTQLQHARFPVGHLPKAEVRRLAERLGLPPRQRPDSQGICFLGRIDYRDFVEFHLGRRPGPIVDADTAERLGEHQGYWFYTIGQRFGLGLSGGPWYVVEKLVQDNVIRVAHRARRRGRRAFTVSDLHWIGAPPASPARLEVKLRHGPRVTACTLYVGPGHTQKATGVSIQSEAESGQSAGAGTEPCDAGTGRVHLDTPDAGLAPGQHAVFYEGEICLGSGIIA